MSVFSVFLLIFRSALEIIMPFHGNVNNSFFNKFQQTKQKILRSVIRSKHRLIRELIDFDRLDGERQRLTKIPFSSQL